MFILKLMSSSIFSKFLILFLPLFPLFILSLFILSHNRIHLYNTSRPISLVYRPPYYQWSGLSSFTAIRGNRSCRVREQYQSFAVAPPYFPSGLVPVCLLVFRSLITKYIYALQSCRVCVIHDSVSYSSPTLPRQMTVAVHYLLGSNCVPSPSSYAGDHDQVYNTSFV